MQAIVVTMTEARESRILRIIYVLGVLDATDGGCSGNAGRPSLMTPTMSTQPQESSSSSSSTAVPRQELGGQWEPTVRIREVESAWWEGTNEVSTYGWFISGPRGEDGVSRVASYLADGRAMLLTGSKFQEGASKAKRHILGEGSHPPATNTVNLARTNAIGSTAVSHGLRHRETHSAETRAVGQITQGRHGPQEKK